MIQNIPQVYKPNLRQKCLFRIPYFYTFRGLDVGKHTEDYSRINQEVQL
jgi:hypothetical protein